MFGTGSRPVGSVPMKFPITVCAAAPSVKTIPTLFPEMTFPAPAAEPPIRSSCGALFEKIPTDAPKPTVPVASVPM